MSRGGYRPGSGRPKGSQNREKKITLLTGEVENLTADEFLKKVWNNPVVDVALRIRAAEIVFRSTSAKGKKEQQIDKAKVVGTGKFAPSRPPISLVKGNTEKGDIKQ